MLAKLHCAVDVVITNLRFYHCTRSPFSRLFCIVVVIVTPKKEKMITVNGFLAKTPQQYKTNPFDGRISIFTSKNASQRERIEEKTEVKSGVQTGNWVKSSP